MSTMEYNTMFGVSSVYRHGGGVGGGGAKYQISGDEKCQNPFTGKLATLPGPARHGVANILPRQGVNNLPFIIISFDCSGITLSVTRP